MTEPPPADAPWMTTCLGLPPNYLCELVGDATNACAISKFLAVYLSDVLLHPVQDLSLVEKPRVEIAVSTDMLTIKKPKCANAVVEVDKDEAIPRLLDDFGAVVVGVGVLRIAAALDVDPDG